MHSNGVTILPGAEAWSARGNDTAILAIHGFTGSPASMRGVAEILAAAGYTVELPRLPGHGTSVADMMQSNWSNWSRHVEEVHADLAARSARVVAVGLSMGGTLAAWLTARHPEIAGLACINPLIQPSDAMIELFESARDQGISTIDAIGSDIADPSARELAYEKTPIEPALSLFRAARKLQPELPRIECPVMILTSPEDHVVPAENSDHLATGVSGEVERITLARSYHVATLDYDKELIHRSLLRFVASAIR